jgi:hypothetical protein
MNNADVTIMTACKAPHTLSQFKTERENEAKHESK